MRRILSTAFALALLAGLALAGAGLAGEGRPTGVAHVLELSPMERDWLAANPVIRVGVWANSPPVTYAGQNGEAQGIVVDYLEIASRELGLRFQTLMFTNFATMWEEVRAGRLDVVPAVVSSPERERLLISTKPFLTIPLVVMTRDDNDSLHRLADLNGRTLMVNRGHMVQHWLQRDHPEINLVASEYDSGLWAVAEGRADGMVGGLVSLIWITRELGIDNLKLAFATEYNYHLGLAVRRDMPVLAGMLNRLLSAVPEVEHNAIYRRWVPIQVDGPDWRSIWRAVGLAMMVVGLILAVILIWNRRLAQEVRRRRLAEEVLTATKRLFETVFNNQLDAIFVLDDSLPALIVECNPAAERMFGYLRAEMLGRGTAFLHVDEQNYLGLREELFAAVRQRGFHHRQDFEAIRQNGEIFSCELTVAQLIGEDGVRIGWVAVVRDISQRRRAEEERQRLFELSNSLLCIAGMDGHFRELNPSWSATLGWSQEELKARPWLDFVHPDDVEPTVAAGARLAQGETVLGFENRYLCKDGAWRWLQWNSVPLLKAGLIYCVVQDVTERKRMEAELIRLATIDSLTGICNRHHFLERAAQEITRARRYGHGGLALLMMDLDHFKDVNDRHGHEAGDKVLAAMAARVLDLLRESDVMGRLGGEEFAVLLVEAGGGEALAVAERLRAIIAETPVKANGVEISHTISIGVASLTAGDKGVEDLLRRADQALYRAKRLGRNRVESA